MLAAGLPTSAFAYCVRELYDFVRYISQPGKSCSELLTFDDRGYAPSEEATSEAAGPNAEPVMQSSLRLKGTADS